MSSDWFFLVSMASFCVANVVSWQREGGGAVDVGLALLAAVVTFGALVSAVKP